jgi:hypothetical protein
LSTKHEISHAQVGPPGMAAEKPGCAQDVKSSAMDRERGADRLCCENARKRRRRRQLQRAKTATQAGPGLGSQMMKLGSRCQGVDQQTHTLLYPKRVGNHRQQP